MKSFKDIETPVIEAFQKFVDGLIRPSDQPLKYYYWSLEFFENVGGLSFSYFPLALDHKKLINQEGKKYFNRDDVYFEVNENSHRHDLYVHNFYKLFEELPDKKDYRQTDHFEYLKEFVLWDILKTLQEHSSGPEKTFFSSMISIQKRNFLRTYLIYRLKHTKTAGLKEYIKYNRTPQGETLEKKLKELDEKGFEDDNQALREQVDKLYILKSHESKIHFVFSKEGGEDKEELRELLDVMGRPETGKLYRGQADSSWKLDSSLTREPKYQETEAQLYYEILSLKPDAFANDHTVYERLITMQHYGMPTRLMDVTRNPLVAIFFACNNMQRASSDGCVFTFKKDNKDILNFEDPKLKDLQRLFDNGKNSKKADDFLSGIWFIKGVAKNQRISNQSGDFIFVGSDEEIKEKLSDLPTYTIIIDSKTKAVLIEQLESLNIHGGAVYPDLTNLSNYIKNKYKSDPGKSKIVKSSPSKKKLTRTKPPRSNSDQNDNTLTRTRFPDQRDLVSNFDDRKFWNRSRQEVLPNYALTLGYAVDGLRYLINQYFDTGEPPLRDDVRRLYKREMGLMEFKEKLPQMQQKIVEAAEQIRSIEK